jgi:hypothetical protein
LRLFLFLALSEYSFRKVNAAPVRFPVCEL